MYLKIEVRYNESDGKLVEFIRSLKSQLIKITFMKSPQLALPHSQE